MARSGVRQGWFRPPGALGAARAAPERQFAWRTGNDDRNPLGHGTPKNGRPIRSVLEGPSSYWHGVGGFMSNSSSSTAPSPRCRSGSPPRGSSRPEERSTGAPNQLSENWPLFVRYQSDASKIDSAKFLRPYVNAVLLLAQGGPISVRCTSLLLGAIIEAS